MNLRLHRYRLTLEDARRLHKLWSVRISRVRLVATLVLCAALFTGLGALIVALTPVKRSVPGFMTGADRTATLRAMRRIDSLQRQLAQNQAYIDNFTAVMDEGRVPQDSASLEAPLNPLPLDSLHSASPAERRFAAMMDEKEKYNLNVLSPLAADALIFADPMDAGIVMDQTRRSKELRVILPTGAGINAIADGRVVERGYDSAEGTYSLMVQSRRGFLTRYSHLATPLIEVGDAVTAGQRLTAPPAARTRRAPYVGIEMWRDGTPLTPGDYICRPPHRQAKAQDIAAPRGQ